MAQRDISPLRSPLSSAASLVSTALPKTTIIINNLHKNDFLVNTQPRHVDFSPNFRKLSLADQIKISILNLETEAARDNKNDNDYYLNHIDHWSNLPFLNRIIVILKDENAAFNIYQYLTSDLESSLTSLFPYIKVSLQENLLSRSKSADALIKSNNENLNVAKTLANFRDFHNSGGREDGKEPEYLYNEPEPHPFDVIRDLSKIGIDVSSYNDENEIPSQFNSQTASVELTDKSPDRTTRMSRTRSLTRTLFKPELKLNTADINQKLLETKPVYPSSPTITLDEMF